MQQPGDGTRIAYVDCFSGVSGDMLLGAVVDAGVTVDALRETLSGLALDGWAISAGRVTRAGIGATYVTVEVAEPQPQRTLADVLSVLERSSLPAEDAERGSIVFRRLAEVEAAVHGETVGSVHLHDVGAVDAVIDVMGTIAGLRLLGARELYCSPLPLGDGEVSASHGTLPVPAPATLALAARAAAPARRHDGAMGELVTPTGAAIVTTLAAFERPAMTIGAVGYGAGSRDPAGRPNVLRLWVGERAETGRSTREMVLIETNIDDMTGEMLGHVHEKLLAEGAADAWLTPVQMKKGRPGVMLSVICRPEEEEPMARLILRETSTLGVRVRPVSRWEAEREIVEFESSLGPAAVKVKRLPGEPPSVAPEYDACRKLAEARGLPLAEVYRLLQEEALRILSPE